MKNLISVLLALILAVTKLSVGTVKSQGSIILHVEPETRRCAWGDELVFHATVQNRSDSDLEHVKIRLQPQLTQFFSVEGSDVVTLDVLKGGQIRIVSFRVLSGTPTCYQKLVVIPLSPFAAYFSPDAFQKHRFKTISSVNVGVFRYHFGFDLDEGTVSGPI